MVTHVSVILNEVLLLLEQNLQVLTVALCTLEYFTNVCSDLKGAFCCYEAVRSTVGDSIVKT